MAGSNILSVRKPALSHTRGEDNPAMIPRNEKTLPCTDTGTLDIHKEEEQPEIIGSNIKKRKPTEPIKMVLGLKQADNMMQP
mmetsp:Transcript_17443/g.24211  ORF Transcript_17443/g.24211 Transcript_17443/m.24211 type:complete len:82 (-) Transcript_17443:121-366(-)